VTGTVDAYVAFGRGRRAAVWPAERAVARVTTEAPTGDWHRATAWTAREPEPEGPTPRVLVVDDDPSILDILGDFVADELGADVERASNGAVALAAAAARRPDLVLLDLRMPVLDGFEACRRLKANPATRAIPVVAVSADSNRAAALACGCDDFVAKPFDLVSIEQVVRHWLSGL
jgi:two-component system cell cycle response regulator DivK